ncbi:hypothetical protein CHS0354_012771 [Potamilus streckersoni]|uniref:Uncharacterized protein n=1 Tax=Potamilus streckersoni TaxID=2493646 RepID=A0AAE0VJJ6_9BIVA|nr:hypothetical protein CHS0354_012771 [Potamilus streckersoni]
MATALQAEARFSQILQCPICLETFKRPKVLPCGHTYCTSCLQSHISNKVTISGTSQPRFPCPLCRADTCSSDPNINIEQWAESLPENIIVSSLLDVQVGTKARKVCDQCVEQEKESLAICLCKDCFQYMCKTCRRYHEGFPSLRRHVVVNLSEDDQSCSVIPDLSAMEICPRHSGESIKFYCGDHKIMCCNTCGFLEHRKCDRVLMIEDMLKSFDDKKTSKELDENLCKFEEHLKHIVRKIKINADAIQKDKTDILEHIHSLKAQLIAKIQALEDNVVASLESNYKSENLNLLTHEAKGKSLITAIGSDRTKLELVMIHGSEVQKFIMVHNMDQNQPRYFRAISGYQKDIKEVRMTFDADKNLQTFVNTNNELGNVNLICKEFDCSPCPVAFETQFQRGNGSRTVRNPQKEGKAVKVSEFNVKVSPDTSLCHISDILLLMDSRILLTDNGNSKIKMFGRDYKYHDSMTLQAKPWSACELSDTEVAVTIPDQKTIQIIGIKDTILKIREIRTRLKCWGIAVVNDQLVITTYQDEHRVLILDIHGKEIMSIRENSYQNDQLIGPIHIKPDKTKSAVYIAYHTGNKILAHNMTWNVLFTYNNHNLSGPAGIDTDREGNIYLCGFWSHCVQQISAEGKLIKTLISKKEETKYPLMIRFYRNKDSFIVTYGQCHIVLAQSHVPDDEYSMMPNMG